ncbi:3'-5' exonuclease isoform X1 [Diospyros lotus]|uniref:3'-5' exonuclease isoform X1 n=1 Tax=Diospyros lotus TaxID=55363 RepID=UPI00224EB365|nr:3'-5' exonuclease isoform X1 [Diospyros lotus]
METGDDRSPVTAFSDWDRTFTDQEIEAIEAAFQSASSSCSTFSSCSPAKRRRVPNRDCSEDRLGTRRRLPESISGLRRPTTSREHRGFGSECTPIRIPDSFSPSLCPRNRLIYSDSSHSKLRMRFPPLTFKGRILYSRTIREVEKTANELLEFVETKKRDVDQAILGLDIEWRPTFRRGVAPGKVAVMQICAGSSHCYVMHITHSGIPQSLQSLLEDPTSLKVGVGIANDASKVFKDHSVSIKTLEDLSSIANQKLGGDPKKWSLASLAETLICKQLPKPGKIRLGNWEADVLSEEQLQYAATDAFASWYLYQALKSLPDVAGNRVQ